MNDWISIEWTGTRCPNCSRALITDGVDVWCSPQFDLGAGIPECKFKRNAKVLPSEE